MSALKNKFVGYTDRSQEQQKDAILAKINGPAPDGLPEMTDHTDTNPWINQLNIWTALCEQLNYYIDGNAQESYTSTAEEYRSLALIAKMFDYRIKGAVGSRVDLLFSVSTPAPSDITIPIGQRVQTIGGVPFLTTEEKKILTGQTEVSVKARQEVNVAPVIIGQTTGQVSQKVTVDGIIVDNSFGIVIQSVGWFGQETFAYSISTDYHYVAGMNEAGLMQIEFGDNVNGLIPTGAQDINASYRTTVGSAGNVAQNTITEIITPPAMPGGLTLICTNPLAASGGYNAEDLATLQKRIPLSLRTLYRAVTEDDYKAITELASGVAKAGVFYVCGKVIDIYITPEGESNGIASQQLLDDTQAYVDLRKMVTTLVSVKPAGVVKVAMEFDVFLLPNYFNELKKVEGKVRIADFLNISKQDIYGKVEIGDLYELLETMEGVNYSKLKKITTIPYARPINHDRQLIWTREVLSGSVSTIHWKIVKSNAVNFQLLKNGAFLGTYAFDADIAFAEIAFNVESSDTYFDGDTWEFVTYKYNDSIVLDEPSVPVSEVEDIILNVTGGI